MTVETLIQITAAEEVNIMKYRYPCTGHISTEGFEAFLAKEATASRRNITLFASELLSALQAPYLSLANSGSSANLVAALALAEKTRAAGKPMTAAISAFTFPTTVSALLLAGFAIRVVDVDEDSFNMSFQKLSEAGPLPSVTAPTHFLGFPCEISRIAEAAHASGGFVLQDACETMGMKISGVPVHTFGDLTTLSFYHPHHLSAFGGGGVIALDQEDYLLTDSITHWGRACKCHVDHALCTVPEGPAHNFTYERPGVNVEISELNACFGRFQLRSFREQEALRLQNYELLYSVLKDRDGLRVWQMPEIGCSPFVFPVGLRNGMTVTDAWRILSEEGIEIRTLMGGAVTDQAAFRDLSADASIPNARAMAETTFFVGIHQTLPQEDVEYVARAIAEIV